MGAVCGMPFKLAHISALLLKHTASAATCNAAGNHCCSPGATTFETCLDTGDVTIFGDPPSACMIHTMYNTSTLCLSLCLKRNVATHAEIAAILLKDLQQERGCFLFNAWLLTFTRTSNCTFDVLSTLQPLLHFTDLGCPVLL